MKGKRGRKNPQIERYGRRRPREKRIATYQADILRTLEAAGRTIASWELRKSVLGLERDGSKQYGSEWTAAIKGLEKDGLITVQKRTHPNSFDRYAIPANSSFPINVEDKDLTDDVLDQAIRAKLLHFPVVPTDTTPAQIRRRKGQDRLHKLVVENYGQRCAVCDVMDQRLLVASHVVGWAEDPECRGDLSNVICLCRMHDALFETGYWSLTDDLELLKKKTVASKIIRQLLSGMTAFRKPRRFPPDRCFVKRHRERVGFPV